MELPLFPLHAVLFPGRPLPLHLFEPRYRSMLEDCMEGAGCFGVVAIRSGQEVGGCAEIFDVGTVARIESVTELADGRYDILTRGTERFRLLGVVDVGTPYLNGKVELLDDGPAVGTSLRQQVRQLRELLLPYLTRLGAPKELLAHLPTDAEQLTWLAAAAMQVELPEQQRLLELGSTDERVTATLRLLRREASLTRHFGTCGSLRPPGPGGPQLN